MDKLKIHISAERKESGEFGDFKIDFGVSSPEKPDGGSLSVSEMVEVNFLIIQVASLMYETSLSNMLNERWIENGKTEEREKTDKKD